MALVGLGRALGQPVTRDKVFLDVAALSLSSTSRRHDPAPDPLLAAASAMPLEDLSLHAATPSPEVRAVVPVDLIQEEVAARAHGRRQGEVAKVEAVARLLTPEAASSGMVAGSSPAPSILRMHWH